MDPSNIGLLCALIILLILSAFFSSAETALTTISSVKLRMLVDEGNKTAILLQKILDDKSKMLTAILIGNNIVNLSASSIATIFTQNTFHAGWGVSIGVGILTLVIIIFGEIIPKTVASMYAEGISLAYARPVRFVIWILTPVIFLLNLFSTFILKIFKININLNAKSITEDELKTLMDVSEEAGIIESDAKDMINNVFDFGDTCAKDIMVPKVDVTMVPYDISYGEFIDVVNEDKYTRYPVYKDSTDNIIGILNIKDLILKKIDKDTFSVNDVMREPYFTFGKKDLNALLLEMRSNDTSICIVLNEYGQADGLITMEDMVEEIVGEIRDEFDESEKQIVRQIQENTYIVEGSINLDDFNEQLGTDLDSEDYESLGGLIMEKLEKIPKKGDTVKINDCTLMVIKMDDNRIVHVKVQIQPEEEKSKNTGENDNQKTQ